MSNKHCTNGPDSLTVCPFASVTTVPLATGEHDPMVMFEIVPPRSITLDAVMNT